MKILNSLGNVVKDKFSDSDDYVEIKLFPGLKVTSKYIPPEQSKSNLDISNVDFVLSLNASFSDRFRNEVRNLHKEYRQNLTFNCGNVNKTTAYIINSQIQNNNPVLTDMDANKGRFE